MRSIKALTVHNVAVLLIAAWGGSMGAPLRLCALWVAVQYTFSPKARRAQQVLLLIAALVGLGVAVDAGMHDEWVLLVLAKVCYALSAVRLLYHIKENRR